MATKIKTSGEIDFNVQEEIIKRFLVKLVVRFRSVCKAWRYLIDSSYFIAGYSRTARQDQGQHLFVRYHVGENTQYVSIVDDGTFPQQRLVPTFPPSIKLLTKSIMVDSCNGVVCLNGYYYDPENSHSPFGKPMVVLCNPSVRKSIAIAVPMPWMSLKFDQTAFGFGVCPVTNDPKIVMFSQLALLHEKSSIMNDPQEVIIYTLSSRKWKSLYTNVPSKSVHIGWKCQVIDRFMYWYGSHLMAVGSEGPQWTSTLIMSFDMTNDTFEVIDLPQHLACISPRKVSISKIRESLAILERNKKHCDVWKMENGVEKSFTKLFTVFAQYGPIRALGFRKNGTLIMEVEGYLYEREIVEYDPNSEQFNALEIGGIRGIFSVHSYMETLVLLGRSDCSSY